MLLAEQGLRPARSAPGRCAGRSSAWSRTRCREKILWKEFRAGEIIVVDAEDDPEKPGEKRLTFSAVEGFEPPAAVELAATGAPEAPVEPTLPTE